MDDQAWPVASKWLPRIQPNPYLGFNIYSSSGRVPQGEEDTTRRPRELVSQRVTRVLGGGEATAVREERNDLSALGVDLVDHLDSVKMVDSGVKTDLVENGDAGGLGLSVERLHGWRDVRSGDDMLLAADSGLDDDGVVGVGDQAEGISIPGLNYSENSTRNT